MLTAATQGTPCYCPGGPCVKTIAISGWFHLSRGDLFLTQIYRIKKVTLLASACNARPSAVSLQLDATTAFHFSTPSSKVVRETFSAEGFGLLWQLLQALVHGPKA